MYARFTTTTTIIIIIGSTALRGPWPSSEASASWSIRLLLLHISWQQSFPGWVVSPTPNPRLSWRADVFCQGGSIHQSHKIATRWISSESKTASTHSALDCWHVWSINFYLLNKNGTPRKTLPPPGSWQMPGCRDVIDQERLPFPTSFHIL
jgi:hypothetical protein